MRETTHTLQQQTDRNKRKTSERERETTSEKHCGVTIEQQQQLNTIILNNYHIHLHHSTSNNYVQKAVEVKRDVILHTIYIYTYITFQCMKYIII